MKRSNLISSVLLGLVTALPSSGGEAPFEPRQGSSSRRVLETLAGDYLLTSRFWPSATGPPELSTLPARRELILDGRVLRVEVGPDDGGFRGAGLLGYDDVKERFWYVWTDTSTTGRSLLEGSLDEKGQGTLEGETPAPGGYAPLRVEIRREDTTEIHDYFGPGANGTVFEWLELRYERRDYHLLDPIDGGVGGAIELDVDRLQPAPLVVGEDQSLRYGSSRGEGAGERSHGRVELVAHRGEASSNGRHRPWSFCIHGSYGVEHPPDL